jgi:23S rRNA pseudouridine1911/1915/1917 synthase
MADEITAPEGASTRLDRLVVALPGVGSRARARRAIEAGKVSVAGELILEAGRMVAPGALVSLDWAKAGTSPAKVKARDGLAEVGLEILYEDDHLLALNKPVGLLTDTATREQARTRNSLRKVARAYLKAHGQGALVVHRIDRDTSGVVLMAKTEAAAEHLRHQFRNRRPIRVYDTVVYGTVKPDTAEWVDVMRWDSGRRIQLICNEREEGAFRASCQVQVLSRGQRATRLQVSLNTGRRNQIRLQAMVRNHSMVGERLYVPEGYRPPPTPRLNRQALHAHSLQVVHPHTHKPIRFEAPMPKDYTLLLRSLGKAPVAAKRPTKRSR